MADSELSSKRNFTELARQLAKHIAESRGLAPRASQILPRLYLSDITTAGNVDTLSKLQITHILSVMEVSPPEDVAYQCERMHVQLRDVFREDILKHLDRTTAFIRDALADDDTNILVHCMQGISRSVTVVTAYLVSEHGMTPTQALSFIQERRPEASPNGGFLRQLQTYGKKFGREDAPNSMEEQEKALVPLSTADVQHS